MLARMSVNHRNASYAIDEVLSFAWLHFLSVQRHYFRVGSHLNLQTVENEAFQSSAELSGTYKRRF